MSLFSEEIRNRMKENSHRIIPMNKTKITKFGRTLRNYRKTKGVSAAQMAKDLNLCDSYISNIEHGQFKPSMERLEEFANYLNVPIEELVNSIDGDIRSYNIDDGNSYCEPDNAYDVILANKFKQMIHGKTIDEKKDLLSMINKYLSEQNNSEG